MILAGLLSILACAAALPGEPPPTTRSATPTSLPTDERLTLSLQRQLGPKFPGIATDHFIILSSADNRSTKEIIGSAEKAFAAVDEFVSRLQLPSHPPPFKMIVVLIRDWESYEKVARRARLTPDEAVPGFFDEGSNCCVLFDWHNSKLILEKKKESKLGAAELEMYERLIDATVVRHEVAHQVLFNLGVLPPGDAVPSWLAEGLAMQFEDDGPVNRYRYGDLRNLTLRNGRLRLKDLLSRPELMAPGSPRAQQAYATAWGLVYFLSQKEPEAFAKYLEAQLPATQPAETSTKPGQATTQSMIREFEQAFGPLNDAFEMRWKEYIDSLKVAPVLGPPTSQPAGATSRPASAAGAPSTG